MLSGTIIHKTCNLRLDYMHYERIRAIAGKPKGGCRVILDELVNTNGKCRRYSIDSSYCSPLDVAQVQELGVAGAREQATSEDWLARLGIMSHALPPPIRSECTIDLTTFYAIVRIPLRRAGDSHYSCVFTMRM